MATGTNKVYTGDDWIFDFQYKKSGDAEDITGATEIIACIKNTDGLTTIESKLSTGEVTITNAPAGKGQITFPKAVTVNAKLKTQNLVVTLTDASGNVTTVVQENYLEVAESGC